MLTHSLPNNPEQAFKAADQLGRSQAYEAHVPIQAPPPSPTPAASTSPSLLDRGLGAANDIGKQIQDKATGYWNQAKDLTGMGNLGTGALLAGGVGAAGLGAYGLHSMMSGKKKRHDEEEEKEASVASLAALLGGVPGAASGGGGVSPALPLAAAQGLGHTLPGGNIANKIGGALQNKLPFIRPKPPTTPMTEKKSTQQFAEYLGREYIKTAFPGLSNTRQENVDPVMAKIPAPVHVPTLPTPTAQVPAINVPKPSLPSMAHSAAPAVPGGAKPLPAAPVAPGAAKGLGKQAAPLINANPASPLTQLEPGAARGIPPLGAAKGPGDPLNQVIFSGAKRPASPLVNPWASGAAKPAGSVGDLGATKPAPVVQTGTPGF